jgi:ATP-binding cassette, subfamily G (WHITE), member 2, SNQ2
MGFGQGLAGTNGAGFQLLVILFMILFGVSGGQLVSALSSGIQVAALWNSFLSLVLSLVCGVTIPWNTMGIFWKSWMYELSPYTRVISAMVSTEL